MQVLPPVPMATSVRSARTFRCYQFYPSFICLSVSWPGPKLVVPCLFCFGLPPSLWPDLLPNYPCKDVLPRPSSWVHHILFIVKTWRQDSWTDWNYIKIDLVKKGTSDQPWPHLSDDAGNLWAMDVSLWASGLPTWAADDKIWMTWRVQTSTNHKSMNIHPWTAP